VQTGLRPGLCRNDIFVHITDLLDEMENRDFARLKTEERVLEFTLATSDDGKAQAREVEIID
jgi:cold shock CspA family protein